MKPRWLSSVERQPRKYKFNIDSIDWEGFKEYLSKKYRPRWARQCFCVARKYTNALENPSVLETFSKSKKNNTMKALIALAKYNGLYREFKERLKDYGITWNRSSSIDAFFRMINHSSSDVIKWYKDTSKVLDGSCPKYLEFTLKSGLRSNEAIESFNIIISLSEQDKLEEYYNKALETLEHFRFPKVFFRNTKNAFLTIVPQGLVNEISKCKPMTYSTIRNRLLRRNIRVRMNELRDYYGTFMVRHGLIKEEVDLLQGRIGKSVFVRHYFSPAINELKQRVFKALGDLEEIIS